MQTFDSFYKQAKNLRAEFDTRFADPLTAHAGRFVWDYWHVPGQYTHLRTPAHAFFAPKLYENFHRHLVEWGRSNLGCHDVSPPWLSCYIEGCKQELHSDVPHGPLAFVFSLTNWNQRTFRGGETFMLSEQTLEYWSGDRAGFEKKDLVKTVVPKFNRLVVFNPAIPHGVDEVRGTHDPREGRLVIHGWFVNPRPFWYGPLTPREVSRGVEQGLEPVLSGQLNLGRGLLSTRLKISARGKVLNTKILVNTLVHADPAHLNALKKHLARLQFAQKRAATELTLPLMIE